MRVEIARHHWDVLNSSIASTPCICKRPTVTAYIISGNTVAHIFYFKQDISYYYHCYHFRLNPSSCWKVYHHLSHQVAHHLAKWLNVTFYRCHNNKNAYEHSLSFNVLINYITISLTMITRRNTAETNRLCNNTALLWFEY